jgi:hypothetical protein
MHQVLARSNLATEVLRLDERSRSMEQDVDPLHNRVLYRPRPSEGSSLVWSGFLFRCWSRLILIQSCDALRCPKLSP